MKRPEEFEGSPNKAKFVPDADIKIRTNADSPFTPFELTRKCYDHYLFLIANCTYVDWCLHGANEVSWLLFIFGIVCDFIIFLKPF